MARQKKERRDLHTIIRKDRIDCYGFDDLGNEIFIASIQILKQKPIEEVPGELNRLEKFVYKKFNDQANGLRPYFTIIDRESKVNEDRQNPNITRQQRKQAFNNYENDLYELKNKLNAISDKLYYEYIDNLNKLANR